MHVPVLLKEVITILDPKPGEFFIDGTFGSGGHSQAIQEKIGPPAGGGKLLAIDWDESVLRNPIIHDFGFIIHIGNYADLPEILKDKNLPKADGLILDLGFSSEQLAPPAGGGRGFSFLKDEPLLMTYSDKIKPAKEILKELSEEELAAIIKNFSQERFSKQIAYAIKQKEMIKPIETTQELTAAILSAVPKSYERGRIHPATRTFMALRIYVNQELENLERILKNLNQVLNPDGRIAIISFHSLEDRLVKNYFRNLAKVGQLKILTKKPIVASFEEVAVNPRSRSAKLRAAIILK